MRTGDIIVVSGNTFISKSIKWIVGSEWTHAALYVGMGNILEIDWNSRARIVKNHYYKDNADYMVMRSKVPFTKEQTSLLIAAAVAHDNTGNHYDWSLLFTLFMKKRFPKVKLFASTYGKNRFICTSLIQDTLVQAGIDWFPGRRGDLYPHEYIESPHLESAPVHQMYDLTGSDSAWDMKEEATA